MIKIYIYPPPYRFRPTLGLKMGRDGEERLTSVLKTRSVQDKMLAIKIKSIVIYLGGSVMEVLTTILLIMGASFLIGIGFNLGKRLVDGLISLVDSWWMTRDLKQLRKCIEEEMLKSMKEEMQKIGGTD